MIHVPLRTFLGFALLGALAAGPLRAAPEYPQMGPDIYDVRADAGADIAAALRTAAAGDRRVILDFGANWCIWCRRLHHVFEANPEIAAALDHSFVVVMVDVNRRNGQDRNAPVVQRYGDPVKNGIPALVVLGPDGTVLTTKDTGELEEGKGYSTGRILTFLATWAKPAHP